MFFCRSVQALVVVRCMAVFPIDSGARYRVMGGLWAGGGERVDHLLSLREITIIAMQVQYFAQTKGMSLQFCTVNNI